MFLELDANKAENNVFGETKIDTVRMNNTSYISIIPLED
jgi:hypothetical protein